MRHAELARQFNAARVDVDADDLVGAHHAGSLHHVEPDPAEAEYGDVGAGLHFGREQHGADAGRHAAADVAHLVERCVFTNLRQRNLGHHHEIGKRGGAHIVEQRLAAEREARGGVRHQAAALGRAYRLAQVGLAREAEFTRAAFRRVERNDVVVFLQALDAGPYIDHDACAFVPENRREQSFRVGAGQGVLIGMADSGSLDLHQHFARLRALEIDFLDGQGRPCFPCNCGFGFHDRRRGVDVGASLHQ